MPQAESRTQDTGTVTGTGNITLAGTPPTGYQSVATALGGAYPQSIWYAAVATTGGSPTGDWEEGYGTVTGATTLVRDGGITGSSNSGSIVTFGAAVTVTVFMTVSSGLVGQAGLGRQGAQRIYLAMQ